MSGIIRALAEVKGQWESESSWCPPPRAYSFGKEFGQLLPKKKKKSNVSWVVIFCLPSQSL